jgi:hypothetical protein
MQPLTNPQLFELSVFFFEDFRSCRSRAVIGFGSGAPAGGRPVHHDLRFSCAARRMN